MYPQHRKSLRGLGVSEERIAAVAHWPAAGCFDDVGRVVLVYTDCLVLELGRVPDALIEARRTRLSDVELLEVTYTTTLYLQHAVMSKALRTEFDDVDERLVEQRLAEELQVSRTVVREAVRRLEAEGLVVVERNRGPHVRPLSDLRGAADDFEAAVHSVAATGQAALADVRALDSTNGRSHGSLLAASRHGRIRHLVAGAVDAPLVFQALQRFERPELERPALFHQLIADAVAAGEAARAGRLMTEHVLQGRDALLQPLSDVADLFATGA